MSSPALIERANATRITMAKYRNKPFDWRGRSTCLHMARFHLRQMGHTPPPVPDIRSAIGAQRALKRHGFADIASLLDSILPRITPASMLVGDLAIMEGDDAFDSIVISAGGKLLGYHADDPSGIKALLATQTPTGAWRV